MSQRRRDLIAVLLLCVVLLAVFADVVVLGANFFVRDQFRYYYPTKALMREVVEDGEFPYWNRYYGGGQPMAANPEYEVFYPPNWLVLLPDYHLGFRLHILLHFLVAGIGMYVLARVLGAGTAASFITATAFMFSGPLLSDANLLSSLLAASWWPWIAAGAIRCLSTGSPRAGAASALAFGMQALVGEPSTLVMSCMLLGGVALAEGVRRRSGRALARCVALTAAIVTVGVLIGAAQIVPAYDLLGDSVRAGGVTLQDVGTWSFPPERAAELLLPRFLGRFWVGSQEIYWGDRFYPEKTFPFIFSIYLGLLAPVLFLAAVAKGEPRFRGAALFCAAIVPLLIGRNAPLLEWLYNLGLATKLRYTERLVVLVGFVVLAFSAVALQRLLEGDRKIRRNAMWLLGLGMIAALVVAALAEPSRFASYFEMSSIEYAVKGAAAFRSDALVAAVKCAALAGLVALAGRNVRVGVLALSLFVILDLAPLTRSITPRVPREFFTEPPLAAELREKLAGARLFPQASHMPQPALPDPFLVGHGRLWSTRNGLLPMMPARWGIEMALDVDIGATWLQATQDLYLAMWDLRSAGRGDWAAVAMAFSNARYRSLYRDPSTIPGNADLREFSVVAFVEGRPSERVYFADRIVRVRNRQELVNELLAIPDPWRHAFVDIPPYQPAAGRVLSFRQTHNSVELDVESEGRGFVVASITAHKYWSATIDGLPLQLRTTNLGYQGFEVPAGRHRVTMRYRNTLVLPSVVVSVTMAMATLAFVLLTLRRGRRAGSEPEITDGEAAPL